jgi:hypothetical protein
VPTSAHPYGWMTVFTTVCLVNPRTTEKRGREDKRVRKPGIEMVYAIRGKRKKRENNNFS